jgi:hypothetical protein
MADPVAFQHHVIDATNCYLVAHREASLARSDHDHQGSVGKVSDHASVRGPVMAAVALTPGSIC